MQLSRGVGGVSGFSACNVYRLSVFCVDLDGKKVGVGIRPS